MLSTYGGDTNLHTLRGITKFDTMLLKSNAERRASAAFRIEQNYYCSGASSKHRSI